MYRWKPAWYTVQTVGVNYILPLAKVLMAHKTITAVLQEQYGKLSDKRYTMLYNQYEGEQEQLQSELDGYKTEQVQYENDCKSAARFLKLVERYGNAEDRDLF